MQKTLTFDGLNKPYFRERELTVPAGGRHLKVEFSTVSPGTELFSIAEGTGVEPGYIAVGRLEDGKRCFVFPSMAESKGCHSNELGFSAESQFFPLPDGVPGELAGFLRFINIGLHPLLGLGSLPEQVAVIGLGPVGNLAAQSAKLLGCRVVGVDPEAKRRDLARTCGIDTVLTPEEFGKLENTFNLVEDTVSAGSTLLASARALREGGVCSMVGIVKPGNWAGAELAKLIWQRNLRFLSGWEMKFPAERTASNIRRGIRWMEAGAYQLRPLLTEVIPAELGAIARGYKALAENPAENVTRVIDWR